MKMKKLEETWFNLLLIIYTLAIVVGGSTLPIGVWGDHIVYYGYRTRPDR